jgi:DNA mismatch endonuclease (patch repair protein)
MADNLSPEVRSFIMSRIRPKDTKPELIVRQFLHGAGYRYRLHRKDLPGKPDIVLPRMKTAILVHGCFWHAHPDPKCTIFKMPSSRRPWWEDKLERNRRRDHIAERSLVKAGWKVIVVWECQLHHKRLKSTLRRIERSLIKDG